VVFDFLFQVLGNICRGAVVALGSAPIGSIARKSRESMIEYHDAVVRVRYAETDQMGVVYHANYLIWFEVGRVELIRALGIEYKRMEIEDDCHIVVADAHCRYHHSARYDEVLRIRTRIVESRNRTVKFSYEVIRDADGKVLANGETTHVICGSNGRPKLLPKKYHCVFSSIVVPQPDRSNA
jgi:acyl-CoA thioester hydrolase